MKTEVVNMGADGVEVRLPEQPSVHGLLDGMHQLLKEEHRWCRGEYAKDENGEARVSHDDEACAWCATGAAMALLWKGWGWTLFPDEHDAYKGACMAILGVAYPQWMEREDHEPLVVASNAPSYLASLNDDEEVSHETFLGFIAQARDNLRRDPA